MENIPYDSRPKVLVADDARDVADVYCFLLAGAGYRVSRAYDGLTAAALAKVSRPDIAILNEGMPGMTGTQVLKELREAGARTKVIITSSANGFADLIVRAVDAGADGCVQQPCPPRRLLTILKRALASGLEPR